MKKPILILIAILVLAGGWFGYQQLNSNDDESQPSSAQTDQSDNFEPQHSVDEPGSIWWVVNKERPLPEDYVPPDLTSPDMELRWASDAESMQVRQVIKTDLEAMAAAANKAGHKIMLVSAYRSYDYQKQLYSNYVAAYGEEEASRFSAKPGTSEHQTGLVVDLGRTDSECEIQACFADTAEGKWLAANAHKFGFIIRYLEGKEDVTGYEFEPWHFRYVDKDLAEDLYTSGQTMEEHFGL